MKDSREHILLTATELFLQKSFKEVTMKELVNNAGLSKGAFYHYFKSKEEVFEKVVLTFYSALRIPDYDVLSTTSLLEFYKNWLQHFTLRKDLWNQPAAEGGAVAQNHYYLIFDGIRLLPSFRELFYKEQEREIAAWVNIINIAKKNHEISTLLPTTQIANIFTYVSDGLSVNLLMANKTPIMEAEAVKAWDSIYALIKV